MGVIEGVIVGEDDIDLERVELDEALAGAPIEGVVDGVKDLVLENDTVDEEDGQVIDGDAVMTQLELTRGDLDAAIKVGVGVIVVVLVNVGVYVAVLLILFRPMSIFGNEPPPEVSVEFVVT